jgi:glucosamine 6-phosphate synthetase-like amidotransferase/phosphosugar isomerase protein
VASAGATTVGPAPAYDVVIPGTGDDSLDAILRVVAAQSLALSWAQRLGVDADDPRGLAKVTASL